MIAIVTGGRHFKDKNLLFKELDRIHNEISFNKLIHGNAQGADSLSAEWAKQNYIETQSFPANWEKYGKSAGIIRNKQMLDVVDKNNDVLIAFPGGTGTENMKKIAKNVGLKIIEIT